MSIEIEVGGELRGLTFNNFAFNAARKKIIPDMIEETSGYAMFYGGLVGHEYINGRMLMKNDTDSNGKQIRVPATFADVMAWYDTLTEEQGIMIANAIKDSQAYKDNVKSNDEQADDPDDEDKKKQTMTNTGEKNSESPSGG